MNIKKTNFRLNSIKVLLYSFLTLCITTTVWSKNYFVSIQGSDDNNGTISFPFKSISYGISKLNDGDTLFIREGKYYEFLNIKDKKFKIKTVIQNYKNEMVEIVNLIKLSNPKFQNNRLEFNIEKPVIDLFSNEKNLIKASYPNRNENKLNYNLGASAFAYNNGKIDANGTEKFNRKNTILCGLFSGKIISVVDTIKSFNGFQNQLDSTFWFWKIKEYIDTGNIFLFNNIDFLDQANEWHYENNTLYLIPENINNKDLYEVQARIRDYILDASNSTNLVFFGLHFFAGKINLQNTSNTELKNCSIKYATPFFTFKNGFEKFSPLPNKNPTPADSWTDDGPDWSNLNSPENWKGNGVEVSGENNTVENCFIAHTWGDGITVWGRGHKIINNIITDFNWIGNDCAGISIAGLNHEISHNEVSYGGRSLLLHSYLMKSKIKYNNIHHGGLICNDLGLTYAFWTDGKGTEIAYNYLHHNLGGKNHCGIYLDNWTYNFKIHHNIINNTGTGININKPHNNHSIYHNTLYNNTYSMGCWGPEGTTIQNVKTFNNITNTNKKERWNYDAFYGTKMDSNHIYFDNDIFTDPENHNFNLKKYSYPIDKGITNEYTKDYKGALPDMGALESGLPPWKYGSSLIIPNEKYYPPKAPLKLELVVNTFDTTLFRWNYPFQIIDSFLVERKSSTESSYTIIARLAATDTTYNDANQPPGEYRYQVRAKNSYGISEPSNSIQIFNPITNNALYFDAEESDLQEGTNAMSDLLINTDNKDWICFKGINLNSTFYDACMVNMAVPCENAWQEIQVRLDHPMGRMIGKFRPPSTGGWDKYKMYSFPIEEVKGTHDVYFRFKGSYGVGTMDWFTFYNSNGEVKENIPYDSLCPFPSLKNREIKMKMFPNPGYSEINLTFDCQEKSTLEVEVFDTRGVIFYTNTYENLTPGTVEIHLHDDPKVNALLPGVYMVKAHVTSKKVDSYSMMKFIKTNE